MVTTPSKTAGRRCVSKSAIKLSRFLLLHQLIDRLRDRPIICIVFFRFGPESRRRRRLRKRTSIAPRRRTSLVDGIAQQRLTRNHLPRVLA